MEGNMPYSEKISHLIVERLMENLCILSDETTRDKALRIVE